MIVRDLYVLKDSGPFEIHSNEEVTVDLELKKQPPCYDTLLTGRVLCDDIPVQEATVKVFDCQGRPVAHASVNTNGIFRIENELIPGEYMAIASAPCCGTSNARCFQIRSNVTTRLNFKLQFNVVCQNGIVYGKVLEEGGVVPIRYASVTLKQAGCKDGLSYTVKTNKEGQYIIYNIVPGEYRIKTKKEGYKSLASVKLSISAQSPVMFSFTLEKMRSDTTSTIYGTITNHDMPVPEVNVFLYWLDPQLVEILVRVQTANDKGEFLFSGIEKGSYIVMATMQDDQVYKRKIDV